MRNTTPLQIFSVLVFVAIMTLLACNLAQPPASTAPQAAAEDPNLTQLHKSIAAAHFEKAGIAGCMAPAKNNEKFATNAYLMQSVYSSCMREVDAAEYNREKTKNTDDQVFLNLCIDTTVSIGPVPKNDDEGKQVISYCQKELDAYKQQQQ